MDLSFVMRITFIGLLAGTVGTGSGGLVTLFTKKPSPFLLSLILSFAAGMMLDVTFLELIPEAIEQGGFVYGATGLIGGIAVFLFLDKVLPHCHRHCEAVSYTHLDVYKRQGLGKD